MKSRRFSQRSSFIVGLVCLSFGCMDLAGCASKTTEHQQATGHTAGNQNEANLDVQNSRNPVIRYQADERKLGRTDIPDTDEHTTRAYQTEQQVNPVTHQHEVLYYHDGLSNYASGVPGVSRAIVMLADNTAYVAVLLNHSASSTQREGGQPGNGGQNRATPKNGTTTDHTDAQSDPNDDRKDPNQHPFDFPPAPGDLAGGPQTFDSVPHHDLLTHPLKQRIAEAIRRYEPHVTDVYISANRDFINSFNRWYVASSKGTDLTSELPAFDDLMTRTFGTEPTVFPPRPDTLFDRKGVSHQPELPKE